ncbi:MAG: aldehyde ferredoxin oxidoreductase [Anaerolineales bacterium]|nr:aldehyde ferredoxin oxidoreductase [Anaerolineales bacterium]MDW8160961.1 aldehyde ferredoxin oxidoreductase C-terminal domain-containing protein [Anaerolineales bacterium]
MDVWRIDVNSRRLSKEPIPSAWRQLGGRALIARILLDEVNPLCDPLGPYNKLVLAPGLLVGHMLSSCDRISYGGKSPLTRGVKESNAGGTTGLKLVYLGIKALILEGAPQDDRWWVIYLDKDGAIFEPAQDLLGLGVYATAEKLLGRYGKDVAIALIGPAGERCQLAAGIQNLDKDRVPSRIAARGGLGALMGSKQIKAIVIDAKDGSKPEIKDLESYKAAQKRFTKSLMEHPQTKIYADYGTNAMPGMSDGFGGLPTRNFSAGHFEGLDKIRGEYMRELLLRRGGEAETTHACMPGCTIRCSNVYADEQGKAIVSPLEYETVGLLGPNLGIDNLDAIARMNYEINDLGLDTIDVGAALGVAAEAGLMEFGDSKRAMELIQEIRRGTVLGRVLGNGAAVTGRALNVRRVPAVKGQAMSAYEPRAIKGTGVTYATSPQGADHTAGLTIRAKVDHLDPKIQAEVSRTVQINMAGYDSLGACVFAGNGFAGVPETIKQLIEARYGWEVAENFLQELGKTAIRLEREFNRRAGFTAADDRLPEFMKYEPLPPNNSVFDVADEDLDHIFDGI